MLDLLQIHPDDNVAVATRPIAKNTSISVAGLVVTTREACPLGAKIALRALTVGDKVIKFGEPIGSITASVDAGGYIHTHNLASDYLETYERGALIDG